MTPFMRAIVDSLLEEYAETETQDSDTLDIHLYSLWVDREKALLYRTRQDGCAQLFFPTPEKMESFARTLLLHGFKPV